MTAKQKANKERFKKVVAEAAKLRKKNPKLTQAQAVKQAWAISYGKKRKVGETHTDTKSHNVNIRVVSGTKKKKITGWRKGGTAIIEHNEEKYPKLKNVRVRRVPKKDPFDKPGTFKKFTTLSGFFDTSIIQDLDALKKEYYKLAKIYHPDAGGTNAQMQQLNDEYEKLLNKLLSGSSLSEDQKNNEKQLDEALRKVIDELIILEGINIEIVGKWIWVSGNTYPVKETFKKAGMFPIKKNNIFYWVYKGTESRGRGNLSMEEIKRKYGVEKIDIKPSKKLTGIINKTKLLANLKRIKLALNKRPV